MPHTKHSILFPKDSAVPPNPLKVAQVIGAYNWPDAPDLSKYKVAIIELGGGVTEVQLQAFCLQNNVPMPSFHTIGIDGAIDQPPIDPQGADGEVDLDCQVLSVAAPGAEQWVIFAENTDQSFANAIQKAIDLQVNAISISWGSAEVNWDQTSVAAMHKEFAAADACLIGNYAAAGDNGSSDGETDGLSHVDYPGSDPYVISCGGTRLILNPDGSRNYEKVWSVADGNGSTGGGLSALFPGRQVPDLAGNADPASGYEIDVDLIPTVVGGTSAAAPLFAGLHLRMCALLGRRISTTQMKKALNALVVGRDSFDVVDGSNGAYSATPGRDMCSGVGVPDFQALLNALKTVLS
jgi:kumamolisin